MISFKPHHTSYCDVQEREIETTFKCLQLGENTIFNLRLFPVELLLAETTVFVSQLSLYLQSANVRSSQK